MVTETDTTTTTSPNEESVAKKVKTYELKATLQEFQFVKVLNESNQSKMMIIHAIKKHDDSTSASATNSTERDAVIIFEKPHFGLDEVKSFLSEANEFEIDLVNDIYNKLCIYPNRPYNNVQVQLIYPANEKHIAKYSMQEMFFVRETPQDWHEITTKYIKESAFDIQWVFNILEHKTESERHVFEDADPCNGFILLPDMKWDSRVVDNLYLLAICHRHNVRSIRDLDASHIAMLENIRDKSLEAIEKKFGVRKHHVRVYVHNPPSFYHLHVHFCHIKFQPPGMPERNYPLNNVIENLKIDSDYYKKATLEIVVRRNEKLFDLFKHKLERV